MESRMKLQVLFLFFAASSSLSHASTLTVRNGAGEPLAQVMVSQYPVVAPDANLSDDGYTPHGVTNQSARSVTRFTDERGVVMFDDIEAPVTYRARAQGYVDIQLPNIDGTLVMKKMTPEEYAASLPSNVWLSQLSFDGDIELKKSFELNCAFCHPQASALMRG